MRVGMRRFDVRFPDDLNLGKRQARAPFRAWGFPFVSRPVPDLGDFSSALLIASGFAALAFAGLFFFADFATGNADLEARSHADFAVVLFPNSNRINSSMRSWENGFF